MEEGWEQGEVEGGGRGERDCRRVRVGLSNGGDGLWGG